MKWKYFVFLSFLFVSHVAFADDCLNSRRAFLKNYIDETGAVEPRGSVMESDTFKLLCDSDQKRLRSIVRRTVRVNQIPEGWSKGRKETEVVGTFIEGNHLLIAMPQKSIANYSTPPYQISIEEVDGVKRTAKVIQNKYQYFINGNLDHNLMMLDIKISDGGRIPEGTPLSSIKKDFNGFATIRQEFVLHAGATDDDEKYSVWENVVSKINQRNFFFLGYENSKEVNLYRNMNFSFGIWDVEYVNGADYGNFNLYSKHTVSETNVGGGVYDVDFNLVGLHYQNKKVGEDVVNIIGPIPAEILSGIVNRTTTKN